MYKNTLNTLNIYKMFKISLLNVYDIKIILYIILYNNVERI